MANDVRAGERGSQPGPATLKFLDSNGNPLQLPLSFPQTGAVTQFRRSRYAGGRGNTCVVSSGAPESAPGSAQLTTTGEVSGFVIFRHNGQEAVVPIESRNASGLCPGVRQYARDSHGIAVNNVSGSAQAVNIPVVIRERFGLPARYRLADAGTQWGLRRRSWTIIRDLGEGPVSDDCEHSRHGGIRCAFWRQIGVIGIRTPPTATPTYTSLPAIAK